MGTCLYFLFPLLFFGLISAAPSDTGFVVTPTEPSTKSGKEDYGGDNVPQRPQIYEMDISSNVSNRFATTVVVSKVKNDQNVAKETTFTVVLPEKAFISEFVMEVGGNRYKAYVKEKEEAKKIYDEAVAGGQSAGHVAVSTRDSNKFTVSVNIEPESKVVFLLTYQELLERRNGQYELIINIHPGQIVKDLNVKVQITETRPLRFVRTPSLRSGNEISKNEGNLNPSADIQVVNSTAAEVKFNPDPEKQKQFAHDLGGKESGGLSGQFVVQYDVERDPHGGEVLLQDGYFVHFFAPSDLEPLPKHVVLVLDSSGSMWGRKIQQVKDAVKSILDELREEDIISIVDFNSQIFVWDILQEKKTEVPFAYNANYQEPFNEISKLKLPTPVTTTNEILTKAKKVINQLTAGGGTNMIGGLDTALYLAKVVQDQSHERKHQPLIIFLTDGEPNGGISSTESITNIVTRLNSENNNVPILSLSFGSGADKEFLRKLSGKNQGFSRHIYEAADASLQIQEFYKQVSSPLLSNITFRYTSDVENVTKVKFPLYFKGSEIVVAGRYDISNRPIAEPVVGWGRQQKFLQPTIASPVTSLDRLWAYLTVKQTLNERESSDNKEELRKKALDLALKYSFVTDVTSLVVVKPNEITSVDTEDAYHGDRAVDRSSSTGLSTFARTPMLAAVPKTVSISSTANHRKIVPLSGFHRTALMGSSGFSGRYRPHSNGFRLASLDGSPGISGPPGSTYSSSVISGHSVTPYSSSSSLSGRSFSSVHYDPSSYRPSFGFGFPQPPTTARPQLVDVFPWLASKLNPNGTLTINQDIYKLVDSYPGADIEHECPQTPLNTPGKCKLLSKCSHVHSYLTDFSVYQRYFCSIEVAGSKLAGVCCPPNFSVNTYLK